MPRVRFQIEAPLSALAQSLLALTRTIAAWGQRLTAIVHAFFIRAALFAPAEIKRLAFSVHTLFTRAAVRPTGAAVRCGRRKIGTNCAASRLAFLTAKAATVLASLVGLALCPASATIFRICL